jgi:hypothetical protein
MDPNETMSSPSPATREPPANDQPTAETRTMSDASTPTPVDCEQTSSTPKDPTASCSPSAKTAHQDEHHDKPQQATPAKQAESNTNPPPAAEELTHSAHSGTASPAPHELSPRSARSNNSLLHPLPPRRATWPRKQRIVRTVQRLRIVRTRLLPASRVMRAQHRASTVLDPGRALCRTTRRRIRDHLI